MKRLLVRATALAGLLAIAVFAVVQTHRVQPAAMAQEQQAVQGDVKKKSKPKSTAARRKPAPSTSGVLPTDAAQSNRYDDRYADRYGQGPAETAASQPDGGRVNADFSDSEAPEAGPDLFPEGNKVSGAASRQATSSDPFTNKLRDERHPATDEFGAADNSTVTDPPTGMAGGPVGDAVRSPSAKKTAVGARKKRAPAAVGQRGAATNHAPTDRYSRPAADVFGPDSATTSPTQNATGGTAKRDPFGDAALAAAAPHHQPMVGRGRPGVKQLEGAQSPTLVVEKVAPDEIQVGKPAVFAIRVQNTGLVAAQGVEIHDVIPQGTHLIDTRPPAAAVVDGRVSWKVGVIKAGDEATVELELMPLAEGEIGSVATVYFAGEASARTRCTRPQLAIDVLVPAEVLLGEEAMLSIKLSNPGTGTATGIVISENIPEQLEHPSGSELEYEVGDLKPGESRQIDLTMSTVKAGQVINRLVARGDGQLQAEQQSEFLVVAPQLEVSMQGPKRRYLERQATYTVTVSNPGTAPAKEVQLVTHLPKGLKFVGANNAGEFDPVTNSVHWVLEELPAKEAGQVTLTTLPIEAGEQMLRVESVAQRGLSAEQEEVVSVEGVAAILFQLADLADPIEVGGETTYEIKVINQGSKAATNLQIVAVFPPQLKPRGAHGPTRDVIEGQQVRFQPLGRLPPKGEMTYQVRAQGLEPGDLRVQVQILTDEMQTPVTKEESTRVYADE